MSKPDIFFSDDPSVVESLALDYLSSDPVHNNLILTLIKERINNPSVGRYWVAKQEGEVVGCALQSPLEFPINLSVMSPEVIEQLVREISSNERLIPGVLGEALTAATFAGKWLEYKKEGAYPVKGQRLYKLESLNENLISEGFLRKATFDDFDLVVTWMTDFYNDIGETKINPKTIVEQRLKEERFWLWEKNGSPVSLITQSTVIEGVVRIQIAFTPYHERNKGYASAGVGAFTKRMKELGYKVILYTDLKNPISNFIFYRLGFRCTKELLLYHFDDRLDFKKSQ